MKIKKAVFPVAGLGTRFIPATKAMAKEMLTVVDKPIIQYAVEEAFEAGIEQIIFVTGRGKKALEDHFDRSYEIEHALQEKGKDDLLKQIQELVPKTGNIIYTRQHQPLGLGHAILCAKDIVGDEPFAVLLADDLIQTDKPVLSEMVKKFDRLRASMAAVMEVEKDQTDKYGILDAQQVEEDIFRIDDMVEKPSPDQAPSNLAIIGRYILTPKIFEYLEKKEKGAGGEIQLTDAMKTLLKEQPIYGYKFKGTRFDCGDKAGFQMANLSFALERPDLRDRLIKFIREIQKKY
ncbi:MULTISPECIES: UTP--glucose-1-phosphate uridylyltransferase GalU [Desulfobacula]|uniref:UTP--glucose-1-phosphate uridylyltransferase n=2 Tax=Desulfobacula TaxID=28222 RepID=K0ND68_DESTT|nr:MULTISPECIES: UTP--glucose-1-phosphate uridylyltransferase GalU [Desulfobacula]CCK78720.1 GalU: UTP--glucose-1-phosphate uridylyltransferase (UDP-glucose pyrophosphorylase) [Desulfobacula toluolica Tol2]SDT87557.1 UTP--glucose-1-phosphate uridylyltransferase [Desulfobacula phenolica]